MGIRSPFIAEIVYQAEKGCIAPATLDRLLRAIEKENAVLVEIPFDRHVALAPARWSGVKFPISLG
jgi:hypothetical protein